MCSFFFVVRSKQTLTQKTIVLRFPYTTPSNEKRLSLKSTYLRQVTSISGFNVGLLFSSKTKSTLKAISWIILKIHGEFDWLFQKKIFFRNAKKWNNIRFDVYKAILFHRCSCSQQQYSHQHAGKRYILNKFSGYTQNLNWEIWLFVKKNKIFS